MKAEKKQIAARSLPEKTGEESGYHIPVLLHEAIEALCIKPDGVYVDCTFGGGGHARAILQKLDARGVLIAFDQDPDAVQNLPQEDERVIFVPQNFRHLQRFLRLHQHEKVDGILADLGVSSHQFDAAERGFSTRFNAAMDMRMDRRLPTTAFDVLQTFDAAQLHKMFEQYGEVTNAKTLAHTIVEKRNTVSLQTIDGFKNAVRAIVKGNPNKYFAQVFQALRIQVNDELGALKALLQQALACLNPQGRMAVITFHSLEDRLVKQFFKNGSFEEKLSNPFINDVVKNEWKVITKKPIVAAEEELKKNARARSAKLRVAERM